MSEQRNTGKRVMLYIFAGLALVVIAWIVFRGTNVFNYVDRANEIRQQETEEEH